MNKNKTISIICLTYNHESSISICIDSMLAQEVSIPFEIIIHDDASTDSTPSLIADYAKKYPDTVVPIYEDQNQYQNGVFIIDSIVLPKAAGTYIAYCEGDDCWCDPHKLQKQFDYMEAHPECSMCGHNTIVHDMRGCQPDQFFFSWNDVHRMTEEEVFLEWDIHSSSYFVRREYAATPLISSATWLFDYAQLTTRFAAGAIDVLPDIMSIYNFANPDGISANHDKFLTDGNMIEDERTQYLKNYLCAFPGRYIGVIEKRIRDNENRHTLSLLAKEIMAVINSASISTPEKAQRILSLADHSHWQILASCADNKSDANNALAERILALLNTL